jgi:hypothetical protein
MAAGDIRWDELDVDWDGSRFTLHVPHDLTAWEARWLELNLPMSIRGLIGEVDIKVSGASRAGVGTALGRLSVGPIALPLRGGQVVAPGKLREIVDHAVVEAYAAAKHAGEHAAEFSAALRKRR